MHTNRFGFQAPDEDFEFFLLILSRGFAGKFCAKQIGVIGEATHPHHQPTQGFARLDLIEPGGDELAFKTHEVSTARFGSSDGIDEVCLGKSL